MKKNISTCLVIICTSLASHAMAQSEPEKTPDNVSASELVEMFSKICMDNTPKLKLENTKAAAIEQQINFKNSYGRLGGFTEDFSYGLQFKPGKKCVVTSRDIEDVESVTNAFKTLLESKSEKIKPMPVYDGVVYRAQIKIGKKKFILGHDTNGGEALIMLKK